MARGLFHKKHYAGLSLQSDAFRFVELEGSASSLKLKKSASFLAAGAIRRDSLADLKALQDGLKSLLFNAGGSFGCPVVLGLPSRDVMIRLVDLPEMPLDDAREALKWDFEKYFPFPYADAAVDVSSVDLPPVSTQQAGQMTVLVATCKMKPIETLLRICQEVGIEVSAIEPVNVAMFRAAAGPVPAMPGSFVTVFPDREVTNIVLGFKDNGILYRTAQVELPDMLAPETSEDVLLPLVREVTNTVMFARNQYRETSCGTIAVSGWMEESEPLRTALSSAGGIPVIAVDPWDAWGIPGKPESPSLWLGALGLALRDLS